MIGTCEKCGNIFRSFAYNMFGVGVDITIEGTIQSCPKCFQPTKILDGTFSKNEDGSITFISGPEETEKKILQLKALEDKKEGLGKEVKGSRSRHIPGKISKKVNERHFFECAWCGVKLTERHHIKEYAMGGEHSEDNLILLCPNCHTQVHNGEIDTKELVKRKSTHCKGDRIAGNIPFELKEAVVKLGVATFKNVPIPLMYNDVPIIILEEKKGEFYLTTQFYDKFGALIFWMSSNRYWAPSHFSIQTNKHELLIINKKDENNYLRILQNDGILNIESRNYLKGNLLDINSNHIKTGTLTINSFNAASSPVGISIEDHDFDINQSPTIKDTLEKYNFLLKWNRKK